MSFELLLIFIFSSIGFTHIVVDGKIFSKFREFVKKNTLQSRYELLECYQCSGVWVGWFVSQIFLSDFYVLQLSNIFLLGVIFFLFMSLPKQAGTRMYLELTCLLLNIFILIAINKYFFLIMLFCGFATSFLSSFAASYMNFIEARTIIELGSDYSDDENLEEDNEE